MENKENRIPEKDILEHEEICKALCLKSALREISEGKINTSEDLIKVNLPDSIEKFKTGNGEGIFATYYSDKDKEIGEAGKAGELFEVVVLNNALYYPFRWGSIITVKSNGTEYRPNLDKEWISKVIEDSSNGEMSLEKLLS